MECSGFSLESTFICHIWSASLGLSSGEKEILNWCPTPWDTQASTPVHITSIPPTPEQKTALQPTNQLIDQSLEA